MNMNLKCLEMSRGGYWEIPFHLPLRPRPGPGPPAACLSNGGGRCRRSSGVVSVSACYNRRPMETPGAYELIDDETGEKFIVWGGLDNPPDSPIPSKDLLSWNPSSTTADIPHSDSDSNYNSARTRGLGGSFGKLKAQRVKALVKKTFLRKQEISQHDDEQVVEYAPFNTSISSHSKFESLEEKKKRNVRRHMGNSSRGIKSQEFKATMQMTATREDNDHSDAVVKHGTEHDKTHKSDMKRAGPEVSSPKDSSAHLRGWGKGGSIQSESSHFRKQQQKLTTASDFFSRKSFRDLGCSEYVIESLRKQLFLHPSRIQAMAFAPVAEGKSCIIADQSGSGKTLAYLAPVIQRLRQEELQGLSKSSSQCPRAVILVPTAELASQVLGNCRSISKFGVPFRSMVVTGGFRQRTQLDNLQQGVDVLIATPGRFLFLIKEGFLQLTNLRCAVLDEVDILFSDEDFEVALQSLLSSSPVTTQYLFVTATLPLDTYNKLVEVFPDCKVIMGPAMHRTSPGLEEVLVDCSGDGTEKTPDTAFLNKKSALLQLVEDSPVSKTIVFCNKIETCRKVENALKRSDRKGTRVRVLAFHAAMAQESRVANMKEFITCQSKDDSMFLICTDRASRGIDFTDVDHVILFDFPRDPSEYVRRVGRTARGARGKGKAFVFVVGKQVSLARKTMERNQKGHPLHDVPSAYELMT